MKSGAAVVQSLVVLLLLAHVPGMALGSDPELSLITIASNLNQPSAIDVDSHGDIFFTEDAGRAVNKILYGTTDVVNVLSGTADGLMGGAFDRDDNFFFSSHSNGLVYRIPAGTSSSVEVQGMGAPEGLDVDASGNVFVAQALTGYCPLCPSNNTIVRLAPNGNASVYVDVTGWPWVESVAVDSRGVVYFERGDGIYRVEAAGAAPELYIPGFGLGRIYIDANDALFFLDASQANETVGPVLMRAANGSTAPRRLLQLPADGPTRMAAFQGTLYITFATGGYIAKLDLPPFFVRPLPDLVIQAGSPDALVTDLSSYFLPGGSGPTTFTVVNASSSDGWSHATVEINGSQLVVSSLDANWTGSICFGVRGSAPGGNSVDSNQVCVQVVPPAPGPSGPSGPLEPQGTDGGQVVITLIVAAALVGTAALSTQVGLYILGGALVGLAAREPKRGSVLDHFVRGRLYQSIVENPGVHFSELKRNAGVGNGAALYHLRVLEKAGFIHSFADGAKIRFCSTEQPVDPERYLLSDLDREIIAEVERTPGINQLDVASRVRRSQSTVSRRAAGLIEQGYLSAERKGNEVQLFLREPVP